MAGLVGTAVGIACAVLAGVVELRVRRRRGDVVSVAELVLTRPKTGVEREAMRRGAIWAFPVYVVVVTVAAAVDRGSAASGFAMGAAGLVFGVSAAVASLRLGR